MKKLFLSIFLVLCLVGVAVAGGPIYFGGFGVRGGVTYFDDGALVDTFTPTGRTDEHTPDDTIFNRLYPWVSATGTITGAVEDFTGFNETDGPGKVTVTRSKITLTDGDRDEDYYVTNDEGAGAITDLTHWVDVDVTALTDDANSKLYFWAASNADDDLQDIDLASGTALWVVAIRDDATNHKISIQSMNAGTVSTIDTSSAIAVGSKSFLSILRVGTAMSVEIYSTAALRIAGAAGDVDTIAGTVVGTAFRYVYGIASYNYGGAGKDISGTVENLWFGVDQAARHTQAETNTYTSDFSAGVDSWGGIRTHTVAGNQDGVSDGSTSKDNCLLYTADNVNNSHYVRLLAADWGVSGGEWSKLTFSFYVPAGNTKADGVQVRSWDGSDDIVLAMYQSVANVWTTKTIYIKVQDSLEHMSFRQLDGAVASFVGANSAVDDQIYLKDISLDTITQSSTISLSNLGIQQGRFWGTPKIVNAGEIAGLVLFANDSVASADGLFVLLDDTSGNMEVFKRVANIDTPLISTAVAYVPTAKLLVVYDKTQGGITVIYNGANVGEFQAYTPVAGSTWSGFLSTGDSTTDDIDFQPLAFGVELVTNGTFDINTDGWSKSTPGVILSVVSQMLQIDRNGEANGDHAFQNVATTTGELYRNTIYVESYTDGLQISHEAAAVLTNPTKLATSTIYYVAGDASLKLGVRATDNVNAVGVVDNISLRKVQ